MRKKLIALFALLSLFAIGACGDSADDSDAASTDDDTSEAASGDTLTKEKFIEEADTICAGLEVAGESVEPPDSPEGMPLYLTELVGQAEEAHKQLGELSPPEDGEDVQQALLDSLSTSIETVKGAITAYESGDSVTGGDLLTQATEEGNAADEEAQAYGFTECGAPDDDAAGGGDAEEPADPDMIEEQPAEGEESTEETDQPAE